jgi:hypothetical protein
MIATPHYLKKHSVERCANVSLRDQLLTFVRQKIPTEAATGVNRTRNAGRVIGEMADFC